MFEVRSAHQFCTDAMECITSVSIPVAFVCNDGDLFLFLLLSSSLAALLGKVVCTSIELRFMLTCCRDKSTEISLLHLLLPGSFSVAHINGQAVLLDGTWHCRWRWKL